MLEFDTHTHTNILAHSLTHSFTHTACARDWCRFAVSWWHTFNGQMGTDPFSNVKTHLRPWDVDGSMDTFLTRVDVAFEFFTKHLELNGEPP